MVVNAANVITSQRKLPAKTAKKDPIKMLERASGKVLNLMAWSQACFLLVSVTSIFQ
ncbi:hypothetical protein C943_03927 [Mariniradius saccharolyticus AK6]|uniref:Uncharacterized protein n=1 Tax=Mariniradius saccharolyticus AK6 TaxID=1239962 RepID=M7X9K5_9BACT|nr:hypothetical protein C943_03927 [Mariniradius saccharolyticus AK6]